jgi:hypothetical protein
MTVTPASLVAAYPEWAQVNSVYPAVVVAAVAIGETMCDETVLGTSYDLAVMLAAGSWLYNHPYSRDLHKPEDGSADPYQKQLEALLVRKGSAWRTVWEFGDFDQ